MKKQIKQKVGNFKKAFFDLFKIVNDPIFDRPLKDIETDYELINELDKI